MSSPSSLALQSQYQRSLAAYPTPAPAAIPKAPTIDDAAVQAAGEAAREAAGAMVGRASTILTSGLGVSGLATTAKKTLLGT